jgi:hypothetical protein
MMTREERQARIAELELELAQLCREETDAALADGAALIEECVRMANAGQKVAAVKLYRNRMGTPLREALDAIEKSMRRQQGTITDTDLMETTPRNGAIFTPADTERT